MTWILIVILAGSQGIVSMRFPNKPSCDQARLWLGSKATDISKTICLPDIEEYPADPTIPDSEKNQ